MSDPTPETLVNELPSRFQPEIAGTTKVLVQLELSGEGGGQWWVRVAGGRCTVGAGLVDKPDVRLIATASDYVAIRLGRLDPVKAAMPSGPVTIAGRYGLAVKFARMFRTG
jgi:putative sterol carrier protein